MTRMGRVEEFKFPEGKIHYREPFFFGEAISCLSGQLDRLGIASSQRTLLAMTSQTVLRQG
jgi:hypothetical protein